MDRENRSAWQRWWAVDLLAVVILILVLIFGTILSQRATEARRLAHALSNQSERQRQAICAILANIPGRIPPEIAHARQVFARPGHPGDCQPIPRAKSEPTPRRQPGTTPPTTGSPSSGPSSPSPTPRPRPTRTPRPRPSPHPTSSPTPSPSPSCDLQHVLRCLGP